MKKQEIEERRNAQIRKSNVLIQKSRFDLSVQQQKIVLYLASFIQPYDDDFKLYEFNIQEFCETVGIDETSGKNYYDLKDAIQQISNKSLWIKLPNGRDTLVRWIEKPYIDENSGTIQIRLDRDMKPFLLRLKDNYTCYELIYVLRMKSKYSVRLYELVKSIHYHENEKYERIYSVDELKSLLGAENYVEYRDFNSRVIKTAVKEINEFTDKELAIEPLKRGRKVYALKLSMTTKEPLERFETIEKLETALNKGKQDD